jgi:hypothetical protein
MFIDQAMKVPCKTHARQVDTPCWWIRQDKSSRISFAICDARARAAGFVGQISQGSLSRNYNKKQEK